MNFFDRQILGAVGEPIRKEFGLGDSALGAMNTAFTILYAFVGIPLGRLADKAGRKWILSAGVFLWSLFTAASGFAQNFWQIFAVRLGVGIGEASCAPAATSLIADYFPAESRAKATSIFMLGLPVGIALSFGVSGTIARVYGWRAAFFVAAVPGLICVLLALFIREPERGTFDNTGAEDGKGTRSVYKEILSSPTMRWLIVSGAIHNFNLYSISAFMTPYLMRFHGLDIRDANFISMIIYGFLSLPGLLLSGVIGDAAKRRKPNGALLVASAAILLSIPFFYFALGVASGIVYPFLFLMGTSVALLYFYYSIVYSTIQNITEPRSRGTAMSLYFMAMYLLGGAFGPYVVGIISDYFTRQAAIASGAVEFSVAALEPFRAAGLRSAMYVIPVLSIVLTAVLYAASRTVKKDIEKLEGRMSGLS